MKHTIPHTLLSLAAVLSLASSVMAQAPQEVEIMLTILLDTSENSTVWAQCGTEPNDYEEFQDLRTGLADLLSDPDVIRRDGKVALGVYFYGGPDETVEVSACDFVSQAFGTPGQDHGIVLVTEQNIDALAASVGSLAPVGGKPYLRSAMMCVGGHVDAAEAVDFSAAKRIMLVITHGLHSTTDGDPALAGQLLLAGMDPTLHEINGVACASGFQGYWQTALNYLDAHIIESSGGAVTKQLLPYLIEERYEAVAADCFGAVPMTACSQYSGVPLDHYDEQLKILTRVALWRCAYDYIGITYEGNYEPLDLYPPPPQGEYEIYGDGKRYQPELGVLLAAWHTEPGDPDWNPLADLSGNDYVDQEDLGMLLSGYGCGTEYGY